jgi:hypothetical protein
MDNQAKVVAASGGDKKKTNHLLQRKDGSDNFIYWKKQFTSELPTIFNKELQHYGPTLMEEPENSDGGFAEKMASAEDYPELRTIIAQEHRRRAIAMTVLWNMLVERLSDDVKELLLASPEFMERRLVEAKRVPAALLRILKEIVTGGVTTDPHYQLLRNLKPLHSIVQKRGETMRIYIERLKQAADRLTSPSPYGLIFEKVNYIYTYNKSLPQVQSSEVEGGESQDEDNDPRTREKIIREDSRKCELIVPNQG